VYQVVPSVICLPGIERPRNEDEMKRNGAEMRDYFDVCPGVSRGDPSGLPVVVGFDEYQEAILL
jgi:hypothetical protein